MVGRRAARPARRAVEAIMSVILIILLVLAFSGGTWYYITKTQNQMQAAGAKGTEQRTGEAGTLFAVDSVFGKNIYVRNLGTTVLKNFTVFVNGEGVKAYQSSETMSPGESIILSIPFDMKKNDNVKITSEFGSVATFIVERSKTLRCGNNICEFPVEESCVRCPDDCGNCLDRITARSRPTTLKLGQNMTFEITITANLVPGLVQMKVMLPNGSMELDTLGKISENTWSAPRTADQNGVYVMMTQIKEKDGPYLPELAGGAVSTAAWWNPAWRTRRPLFSNEEMGAKREFEYTFFNFTGLTLATGSCNELRFTNQLGVPIYHQVLAGGSDWCYVVAPFDAIPYIDNQVIGYVYYNNPAATAPNFVTDLLPFNAGTGCMENGDLRLCLGKAPGDGGITYLSSEITGKANNLLQVHSRDTKYYRTGIQPQVDYREGLDLLWCSNYTVLGGPQVLTTGAVYQQVNYTFGTTCEGTPYAYRYTIGMYANRSGYDFGIDTLTPIFFTPSGESLIAAANWDPSMVSMTKEGTVCAPDNCYIWSDIYSSPQSLGVGTILYSGNPYSGTGTLLAPGTVMIKGVSVMPDPVTIIVAKTIVEVRDTIFEKTMTELITKNGPLSGKAYLGEEETEGS